MLSLPKHGFQSLPTRRLYSSISSPPRTIFSGIQPTGIPHLGNYLGALRQWVTHQNESSPDTKLLFCIVDLHALTVKQEAAQLRQWKRETLATFLAIGLDPKRSILFHQSSVPAHAELHWLLSCNASMGYLSRMTQWKSKLALDVDSGQADSREISALDAITKQKLKLGLFSYPVLQAADVLVHGATHVPVGEDQLQHIEFARECAGNFNALYGSGAGAGREVLVRPTAVLGEAKRIMNLKNPKIKMSKSAADAGTRILLTDGRNVIERKIRQALSDSVEGISYDVEQRPGVSNLIDMLVYLSQEGMTQDDIVRDLKGMGIQGLKARVSTEIDAALRDVREKFEAAMADEKMLEDVAQNGAERAQQSAKETLDKVKTAMGLQ